MTDLAFGVKCGLPSVGENFGSAGEAAFATPSLNNVAPSANPVKPMPRSERNMRRGNWPQEKPCLVDSGFMTASSDGEEIVLVQQCSDEAFAGAGFAVLRNCCALLLQERIALGEFRGTGRAGEDLLEGGGDEGGVVRSRRSEALGDGGPTLINTRDATTGDTALHIVTARRDLQWMTFLLYKGSNVNARNDRGETPLSLAVGVGFVEGVDMLLSGGARVNDPGADGETPLIAAVHQRNIQLVRTLIKAGGDPTRADNSGRTARDYAQLNGKDSAIAGEIEIAAKAAVERKKQTYGPSF